MLGDALTSETLLNTMKARQNGAFLENLSPAVAKRVEVLEEIQSEHDELEAKFFEERRALENKYQKLYQPLYTKSEHDELEAKFFEERRALENKYQKLYLPLYAKRYEIVNGVVEVDGVSNEPAEQVEDKFAQEKGVPYFWLTAMKSNEVLAEWIQEQDEEALKYLKDIKWYKINLPKDDNKKGDATEGFNLEFFFDPNPYFKNSVLAKTYYMVDEDEPLLEKAIGTQIKWFREKCLTVKILKKPPRKRSKNANAKPRYITETFDSFFNFFSPPEVLEDDDEIEEEAAEELRSLMKKDYDIGSAIREKIIPHAVSWFTREAALDDEVDDDDDEEDEDDDDEEDEDDDDEEDEDDDDKTNSHKKVSNAQSGASQEVDARDRYSAKHKAAEHKYVDVDETALAFGFFLETRRKFYIKGDDTTNFVLTPDAYDAAMLDFNSSKDDWLAGAKERYSVQDNNVDVSASMKNTKPRKLVMPTRARELGDTLLYVAKTIYGTAVVSAHRKKYPDIKFTRKLVIEAYDTFLSFPVERKAPYVAEAMRIYLMCYQGSDKLTDQEVGFIVPEVAA